MSLKAKIKSRLKAKYSGVNLSTKRIDAIADRLSKKLTDESEESEIDQVLEDANEVYPFADIAKDDDRIRTLESKKPADPKEDSDPDPADPKPTDLAAIVQAAIAPLVQEVATLKAGKIGDTRKSQLEAKLKDSSEKFKGTVLKAFTRMNFETDEDFEAYLVEVEEDAKGFAQSEADEGLGGVGQPLVPGASATTKSIDAEIAAWAGSGSEKK